MTANVIEVKGSVVPVVEISTDVSAVTVNAKLSLPSTVKASDWSEINNKPFITIGNNLKVIDTVLTVDTTTDVEEDNTKPITSGGVYREIGNIEALMATI